MKKILLTLFVVALAFISASAQKIELEKVTIDKDAGTLTKKTQVKLSNYLVHLKLWIPSPTSRQK
ncbi:MAG: hypothetical protein J6T70_13385 [Bacteroidales bacterium]|nr:hypothetical protein [Bacteroidales bacterium]